MRTFFPTLVVALTLAAPALAADPPPGNYTLADIVVASQRGLPADVVLGMVASPKEPWTIDGETAVRLLRSGVAPGVLEAMTAGAHPTPAEVDASKVAGPAWAAAPAGPPDLAPFLDHRIEIERPDGTSVEGELLALNEANAVVSLDNGSVEVVPKGQIQAVYLMDRRITAGAQPPPPPDLSGVPSSPALPTSADRDDHEPAPGTSAGRRTITNLHGEAWASSRQLTYVGVGTTAAGLVMLAAIQPGANGQLGGLRLVGFSLAALGTGSIVTGSLLGEHALSADGYELTPAAGWIGAGVWATGLTAYAVDFAVQGEPTPLAAGAVLMGGGAAIGLIQVGVNEGRRHHQLRAANALGLVVSPLYDGEHAGFILTAR